MRTSVASLLGIVLLLPSSAFASERCTLDGHAGIPDADAETAADIVCHEAERGLPGARLHVRLGALGGRVVLTLAAERGGTIEREQLVLSDVGEVPVAAPRLVDALGQHKPAAETVDTTNVVGGETRAPKRRPAEAHGLLEPVALALPSFGASGGARVGVHFDADRWSFGTDMTLAGYSFTGMLNVAGGIFQDSYAQKKDIITNPDIGYAALAAGARYHLSDSDASPWVGGGAALEYVGTTPNAPDMVEHHVSIGHASNFGAAAYGEVGLDFARTRHFGGTVGLRCDAPAFALEWMTSGPNGAWRKTTTYTPVFTFGIGLRL